LSEVKKIPLIDIIPCPLIPEKFDLGDISEIVKKIENKGDVDLPLKVRLSKTKKGKYEQIWGKKRYEGSLIAGMKEVSCIIEDIDDNEVFKQSLIELMYILNPIEEAEIFKRWKQRCGITYIEIAHKMGKGIDYIYKRIKLLDLPESDKDRIKRKYKRWKKSQYL